MRILLTNDDGITAPGLLALWKRLADCHQVCVVAPDTERSAVSHAITLHLPLRVQGVCFNGAGSGYAVSGTPADCVKLAVLKLLPDRPDVVISGINPGPNVGFNLNYSGTVSGAREAALLGLPALAVSINSVEGRHYEVVASFAEALVKKVAAQGLPPGTFLNVNAPDLPRQAIRGVRVCRQGVARLEETFHERKDPRNRTYYWQGSETQLFGDTPDEDGVALGQDCITITPVRCDMTDYGFMEDLKEWDIPVL